MKNKTILIFSVLTLLFFASCKKEEIRWPNMITDFAIVVKSGPFLAIELDNGTVLMNEALSNSTIEDGSRVIVRYTHLEDNFININAIQEIYLGSIEETNKSFEQLKKDPVKLISAWVTGGYLNLSFKAEYHSQPHTQILYIDTQANHPTLYFSYSRETDPPGAYTQTYSSFKLEGLEKENSFLTLHILTDEGNYQTEVTVNR